MGISLKREGVKVGKSRLGRLLKEAEITGIAGLRKKKGTTRARKKDSRPKDLVNRNFNPESINCVWASDIKQIKTLEGWVYLAIIIDLCNREIIGWCMRSDISQTLVSEAIKMALKQRRIDWAGFELVFHSDRGSQYTAEATRRLLLRAGIRASVGKVACCFDNAVSESFFHSLEVECIQKQVYATREQAKSEVFSWMEGFYNRTRLHSTLGYLSPRQFLAKQNQLEMLQVAA
ncbi:MAG: IS3 family transposase [Candidatus Cloacimonetes bacterium]|nr:IS3 family transposase [Candidatus Cloacimonadota bacterium]